MTRCTYLVEYKLAKGQLREIEDFIDRGQKSLFLGELLTSISKSSKWVKSQYCDTYPSVNNHHIPWCLQITANCHHGQWWWHYFAGVDLCEGRTKKLPSLSSMASMATTAAANYGRPVTKGSRLFLQAGVYIIFSPSCLAFMFDFLIPNSGENILLNIAKWLN